MKRPPLEVADIICAAGKSFIDQNRSRLTGLHLKVLRSLQSVDLHLRPIYHRLPERVRAHVLLCLLAYHVEWHMRQALAPLLFDDEQRGPRRGASAPRRDCPCKVFKTG